MADLELIERLNRHYGKRSTITEGKKLFAINEALDPDNIQKAITDSLASLGPAFTMYFDFGLPADVVLLYIDVCNFSTRFSDLDGEEIGDYFDAYYDIVIPIIYKYGGEVDKIMGDGIICIFGPPFRTNKLNDNITNADQCAKEIVRATINSRFESKIAMHSGTIHYFKNKTGLYKEFTIIGKPVTELFRLESISIEKRINYYDNTAIRSFYSNKIAVSSHSSIKPAEWTHVSGKVENLKGVSFENFFSIRYNS